jgi:hypothetical protein
MAKSNENLVELGEDKPEFSKNVSLGLVRNTEQDQRI